MTPDQAFARWLRAVEFCLPSGATLDDYPDFSWHAAWSIGLTPEEAVRTAERAAEIAGR